MIVIFVTKYTFYLKYQVKIMTSTLKWIIYNRVSTDDQSKNGVSLDYQLDSCLKFAKSNWISVSEEHIFQESYSWAFLIDQIMTNFWSY